MADSIYKFNDKAILLIGVNHLRNNLSPEYMRKLVDKANQFRKICYLVEYDRRLNKKDIRHRAKKGGDLTTRVIMPQLKKEYGNVFDNICIKGWDSRPEMVTQNIQNMLYSNNVNELRMGDVEKIIKSLPFGFKGDKSKYHDKEYQHLKYNFSNDNVYFNLRTGKGFFAQIVNQLIKAINHHKLNVFWKNIKLKELYENFGFKKRDISGILVHQLRKSLANASDLILLEKLLDKTNKTNYIIFLGLEHYKHLTDHFKLLKI